MTRSSSKLSSGGGGDIATSCSPRATRTTRRSVAAAEASSSTSSFVSSPSASPPASLAVMKIEEAEAAAAPLSLSVEGENNHNNDERITETHNTNDSSITTTTNANEVGAPFPSLSEDNISESHEVLVKVEAAEEPTPTKTPAAAETESTAAMNSNNDNEAIAIKKEDLGVHHEEEKSFDQNSSENDKNSQGEAEKVSASDSSANNASIELEMLPLKNDHIVGDDGVVVASTSSNLPTITEEKCADTSMAEAADKLTDGSSDAVPMSNSITTSEPLHKDIASTKNSENAIPVINDCNNDAKSNDSSSPSFSMTLAIGPADTQRVFHASKAFNVEIQKLQNINRNASINSSEGNAAVTTDRVEPTKRKSVDADKKKPAIVHSPPSRTEDILQKSSTPSSSSSSATAAAAAAADAVAATALHLDEATNKTPSTQTSPTQKRANQQPQSQPSLIDILIPAAKNTNDGLILSFVSQLEIHNKSVPEQQVSLLFFLDADKSTKLLAAFGVLSNLDGDNISSKNGDTSSPKRKHPPPGESNDASSSKFVARKGLIQLFQSFLLSISTCVHGRGDSDDDKDNSKDGECDKKDCGAVSFQQDNIVGSRAPTPTMQNTTPSTLSMMNQDTRENDMTAKTNEFVSHGDWKGSDRTQREILEVATFAADNLIEYARKESADCDETSIVTEGGEERSRVDIGGVSFDMFGKWYNSGGFSRVPWLELLDLSKWDYRGGGQDNASMHNSSGASSVYPFQQESSTISSPKRAKLHNCDPLTPAVSTMKEPIGSPTSFFASAAMLEATPRPLPSHPTTTSTSDQERDGVQSFSAMFGDMDESRTVVSFDFSGSTPSSNIHGHRSTSSFHIDITEENLINLRNLVRRTGLASMTPQHVESLMLKHARIERHKYGETIYVISRTQFGKFIREVVPKESSKHFNSTEIENFSNYFTNFFTCFDYSWSDLKKDEVNAKELMVGFTFLFAGNKSVKLAAAFDMLDVDRVGYLTQRGLMQYLRSYLTMLAGISLLSANKKTTTEIRKNLMSSRRDDAFLAVENGAKWTMSHFMRAFEQDIHSQPRNSTRSNAVTFEGFAKWYTEGGYAVAPWLELLDLQKFLSLIGESSTSKYPLDSNDQSLAEVLFTFPLAKKRSLVVLRDDAHYVRSVVNELGLLSLTSEDIWNILFNDVANSVAHMGQESMVAKKSTRMQVDQMTFVHCMMRILSGTGKIKQHSSQWPEFSPEETLKNFYLSFDLEDTKRVPLNQLMCGLTLLCGGKKSNKLVFAFGLFCCEDSSKDGQTKAFMTYDDFFYFFRSFLIVMFSCCNQSLSLSADAVTQYISDTAKFVADDVTSYWKAKQVEKIKFENFSEWYNEGGFETAPWLELLDLKKWVLADQDVPSQHHEQQPHHQNQPQEQQSAASFPLSKANPPETLTPTTEAMKGLLATPSIKANGLSPFNPHCPPAPDDDHLFDLDIGDAEEDAMDLFLQQESAAEQGHIENVDYVDPAIALTPSVTSEAQNALKFNLLTRDEFEGYTISIGANKVQLLQRIVTETGLFQCDAPTICRCILYDSKSRRHPNLTRKTFHAAMKRVFDYTFKALSAPVSNSSQEELSRFTDTLFEAFDRSKVGKVSAVALACGFTVLCGGRKSDKLEHVFELLDEDKDSLVSRQDITRFIQSFLVMLMSVSSSLSHIHGGVCVNDSITLSRAIDAGSEWATSQVFDALQPKNGTICFDDFADWYTKGGYQSMPWLELLDLRKWVLSS